MNRICLRNKSQKPKSVVPIRNKLIAKARSMANFDYEQEILNLKISKSNSLRTVKSDKSKWSHNNMLEMVKEEVHD